jgi:hypothetical protein
MEKKKRFADDLDKGRNDPKGESESMNQYGSLHDKWNDIQEAYLEKYPELETEELYFEGGGFEGLLEKISEIRGKTVKEIRTEIQNW